MAAASSANSTPTFNRLARCSTAAPCSSPAPRPASAARPRSLLAQLRRDRLAGVRDADGDARPDASRRSSSTSPTRTLAALRAARPRRPRQQRRDRGDRPARVPAARRAAPPARGQRRRPARGHAGVPAGAARDARPDRQRLLDLRPRRAAALRPVRGVEVRARGAQRLAAPRAARRRRDPRSSRARSPRRSGTARSPPPTRSGTRCRRTPTSATARSSPTLRARRRSRATEGEPPEAVARDRRHALTARSPRTRYVIGRDARIQAALARALPGPRSMDRARSRQIVEQSLRLWNNRRHVRHALQVLLASLCFGTTGTAQALGPDGLAPGGRRRGADPGRRRAARPRRAARQRPRALPRLPRRPVADRRRRGRDLPARRSSPPSPTPASRSGRSSRSAPRPRSPAGSSGRSSAARPTRAWAMATALACAGVAMLALAGADATISLPGVGLALSAGASYAGYTLAAKRMLGAGHAPETVMAGAFGLGAVAAAARARGHRRRLARPARRRRAVALPRHRPDRASPTCCSRAACKRLSAAETATLTLAEPLTATLLGVIVLSERLSAPAALGARADPRRPARARGARHRAGPLRSRRDARSRPSPTRCAARSSRASAPAGSGWSSRS